MEFIMALLALMPRLIQLGEDITAAWNLGNKVLKQNMKPTDEDWNSLHQMEDALRRRLHAPRE